ncbi:hypothetical protein PRZ48_001865 [Zasmidium cellare]|uniref:Uncharacterized protein n=1 Tax=Zasmidium cellare TaxID=395010 RepID=A0ABR0F2N2_ZASCE|nr:hypothetical protein PRZ48_001865 [Zasmidium cellare]
MAKDKTKEKAKGARNVPNKHLHARVSFLHQAAVALAAQESNTPSQHSPASPSDMEPAAAQHVRLDDDQMDWKGLCDQRKDSNGTESNQEPVRSGMSFHLSSQLRQVARKSQIRLHPSLKRAACKTCNAVLVEGQTCNKHLENLSKGGKKRQADVLVLECTYCGSKKRFPVGAERQEKRGHRIGGSDHRQKNGAADEKTASSLPP